MDENDDDDNHALQRQLARARTKWGRIAAVLRSQGVNPRAMGYFYKATQQASQKLNRVYYNRHRLFHITHTFGF